MLLKHIRRVTDFHDFKSGYDRLPVDFFLSYVVDWYIYKITVFSL